MYSQFGESEIIDRGLESYTGNKFFVEIGCLADYKFSNVRHLEERGWSGIYIDKDEHPGVICERITSKNINDVLKNNGVPEEIGVMSIDIDGNDYHVLSALKYRPFILVVEFNPRDNYIMPENDDYEWHNDRMYGASKEKMLELAEKMGYEQIGETTSNLILWLKQ